MSDIITWVFRQICAAIFCCKLLPYKWTSSQNMNFGEKKTTKFLLVFYRKKTMRRYFSPYCWCMMKMLRERIFDKKHYQPNFLGRNQRWLFAGRDTEAPESWDWGLGDIERCWLMSTGVLGCVFITYVCFTLICLVKYFIKKSRIKSRCMPL